MITPFVLGIMSVGLNILIRHSFMDLWVWITALVPWPQLPFEFSLVLVYFVFYDSTVLVSVLVLNWLLLDVLRTLVTWKPLYENFEVKCLQCGLVVWIIGALLYVLYEPGCGGSCIFHLRPVRNLSGYSLWMVGIPWLLCAASVSDWTAEMSVSSLCAY